MSKPRTKCPDCGEMIYRKDPQFCPECGLNLRKKPETTSVDPGAFLISAPVPAPAAPVPAPAAPVPAPAAPVPAPAATKPSQMGSSTTASVPVTARTPNQKNGGIIMKLGKIWLPLIVLVIAITGLILSIVTFPLFMGGWAVLCTLGAILMIIGSVFGILRVVENQKFNKVANRLFGWLTSVGAAIFLLTLFVIGMIAMASYFNRNFPATDGATIPAATDTVPAATDTVPAATETAPVETISVETGAIDAEPRGIDIPSMCWMYIPAGSIVSADISIYNGDNHNEMIIINDGLASTADMIYFKEGMNVWFQYGGYIIPTNATEEEISDLIISKLNLNVPTIRYFSDFGKLGEYEFITYTRAEDGTYTISSTSVVWVPLISAEVPATTPAA